jgi:hypothetical protein
MSQKEISANMNPPNILGEPTVQDKDKNLHKHSVEGEESSLSGILTFWPKQQQWTIVCTYMHHLF